MCMITIRLSDSVYRKLKEQCKERKISISQLIEEISTTAIEDGDAHSPLVTESHLTATNRYAKRRNKAKRREKVVPLKKIGERVSA